MTLCPGGCGQIARECCASVIGDAHQSRCEAFGDPLVVRVDQGRLHLANIRRRLGEGPRSRELVCTAGCDLSGAVVYDVVGREVLAEVDPDALCPGLLAASTTR